MKFKKKGKTSRHLIFTRMVCHQCTSTHSCRYIKKEIITLKKNACMQEHKHAPMHANTQIHTLFTSIHPQVTRQNLRNLWETITYFSFLLSLFLLLVHRISLQWILFQWQQAKWKWSRFLMAMSPQMCRYHGRSQEVQPVVEIQEKNSRHASTKTTRDYRNFQHIVLHIS